MNNIKVSSFNKIPKNFTGIATIGSSSKAWFKHGQYHRLDGPAVYIENIEKYWYKEDKLHRLDGPAIEYSNGDKFWFKEDKLHRLDGPAYEGWDGSEEWWISGEEVTEEEFPKTVSLYICSLVMDS